MNDELLPCPFCGGKPERVYKSTGQTTHIECTGCKAQFPKSTMSNRYDEAWNTRTPEQAIAATLGRGTCEWILEHSGTLYDKWRCSNCGYLFVESRVDQGIKDDFDPNYCPNCGAKVVDA